eukprot:9031123-Alexandrium_andersonii.AAC.1
MLSRSSSLRATVEVRLAVGIAPWHLRQLARRRHVLRLGGEGGAEHHLRELAEQRAPLALGVRGLGND